MDTDQESEVTLFNVDDEFEFIEGEKSTKDKQMSKNVTIKSNEGVSVNFMIKPLKVGNIKIKVIAESGMAGDGVERQLKVEPEGVTQYFNDAMFIDLRDKKEFEKILDIQIPANAVPDSTHVEVSAVGDILGPSINNLDKLM